LSSEFRIAETLTFQKKIRSRVYNQYYARIKERLYPSLRNNPYFGVNIKRLKGELSAIYRIRIGDYRLFYTIDPDENLIFILDILNRKDAYHKR
jgi:mRNA interferase RelE/StbE